jgi:hypothetical protein
MDKTFYIIGSRTNGAIASIQGFDNAMAFLLAHFQWFHGMSLSQAITACAWVNSYKDTPRPRGISDECLGHYIGFDDQDIVETVYHEVSA